MILSIAGWDGFKGFDSSCQSLSVKNTLKMDIDFSGLNTFSTPSKLTDLAQTNPANLRKKDVKNPLSY